MIRRFHCGSNRRRWLIRALLVIAWLGCGPSAPSPRRAESAQQPAPATAAATAKLPKIDVHLHIDLAVTGEALAILGENGIALGLNASGGEPGGGGLEQSAFVAKR